MMTGNIMIRILDRDEFLKYLRNGNCNGQISKQDVNVWNMPLYKDTNSVSAQHEEYNTVENNIIAFLLQNNSLNTYGAAVFLDKDYNEEYQCAVAATGIALASWRVQWVKTDIKGLGKYSLCDETKGTTSITAQVSFDRNGEHWEGAHATNILNVSFGFRPVFEFVDNEKSANICY